MTEGNHVLENTHFTVAAPIHVLAALKNQTTEEFFETRPDFVEAFRPRVGVAGLEFRSIAVPNTAQLLLGKGLIGTLLDNIGKTYASAQFTPEELSAWGVPDGNFETRAKAFGKAVQGMAGQKVYVETHSQPEDSKNNDFQYKTTRFDGNEMTDFNTPLSRHLVGRALLHSAESSPAEENSAQIQEEPSFLQSAVNATKAFAACAAAPAAGAIAGVGMNVVAALDQFVIGAAVLRGKRFENERLDNFNLIAAHPWFASINAMKDGMSKVVELGLPTDPSVKDDTVGMACATGMVSGSALPAAAMVFNPSLAVLAAGSAAINAVSDAIDLPEAYARLPALERKTPAPAQILTPSL